MAAQFHAIDKDAFVTDTILMLVRFGDYLATVESGLEHQKLSGLNNIMGAFGQSGRLKSAGAKKLFTAHRKRFDRDMARFSRYSAATTLYSLLEVRLRAFMEDFEKTYPGKPDCKKYLAKSGVGFVRTFQSWLLTPPFPVAFPQPRIWKQLQDFQLIRNCIVHAHGDCVLLKRAQPAKDAVDRTRRTSFSSDGILILESRFVFQVMERIQVFFQLLFRSVGYSIALPPGHAEKFAQQFAGFEAEIEKRHAEFYAKQTINLGGQL
jgi:hypothetical protein